jgi:hypothetical protein
MCQKLRDNKFNGKLETQQVPDRDDREFCQDDSTTNSSSDFLRALHSQSNVSIVISDSDEGLETCSLSSPGLLLYGHDLQNLGEKLVS